MRNFEVARILRNISILLDMDDVQFKPRAYEKAARSVEALEAEVEDIYQREGFKALTQIPGVGESIAEKIVELIKTGRLGYYEELLKKVPVDLDSLWGIEGLGPKTIKVLYQKLGIRSIDELEKAALAHEIFQTTPLQGKNRSKYSGCDRIRQNRSEADSFSDLRSHD